MTGRRQLRPRVSLRAVPDDNLVEDLESFVAYRREHLAGDEKGEAQVFLDRLFRAFGHGGVREAGANLEERVRKRAERGTTFADLVWKPRLLIEMKKAGTDLSRHYQQAFDYWVGLVPDRPRYVALCNFDSFWIYDFDRQIDEPVDRIAIDDLPRRWEAMGFLLPEPAEPLFKNDLVEVTRDAAATLAALTKSLIGRGIERATAQRFTTQCVMAMFAEDANMLPRHAFTSAVGDSVEKGGDGFDLIFGLFREMDTPGVTAGGRYKGTPYFNGGLFRSIEPFPLNLDELVALYAASSDQDWKAVRPEIFGTLFEQSLKKEARHAFGAHFTSGTDIQRIVRPTIVRPWLERIDAATTLTELHQVEYDLSQFRVLDPACGCGNFLYVAYRELRRVEQALNDKIQRRSRGRGGTGVRMGLVSPSQFYGIDIDPFAVEIAKVTLELARKLSADEMGSGEAVLPLQDLDSNFTVGDALLMDWPEFDACIGNPPFLGRRKIQQERGASYVAKLDDLYPDVGGVSDYVVYWFRLAHDRLPPGGRAGLVGTQSIRHTSSRKASLDYIADNGGTIVEAWSSFKWSGEAQVTVSVVNWVKGDTAEDRVLWLDEDRRLTPAAIPTSLSQELDLRRAISLRANATPKVFFQGQTPGHEGFVVTREVASQLRRRSPKAMAALHPYLIGHDLLNGAGPSRWIIDFDIEDAMSAKALAPSLFQHLRQHVLPDRTQRRDEEAGRNAEVLDAAPDARVNRHHARFLDRWWELSWRRADMLKAVGALDRYIATSRVASELRRPVFVFVASRVHAGDALQCFAFDDDYSFGILHSTLHERWFRGRCSTLETRLRYTSQTVFNTFPWPQKPSAPSVTGVVDVVSELLAFREKRLRSGISLAEQYNSERDPGANSLHDLHLALDRAVLACYDFDPDEDPLVQLLDLNLRCAEIENRVGGRVRQAGAGGLEDTRRTDFAWK